MVFADNFDLDWVVKEVMLEYSGIIDDLVLLDEAVQEGWEIPVNWQVGTGWSLSDVIESIWGDAKGYFPLFLDFVEKNLSVLLVGKGRWGTCLIYFFTEINFRSDLGYDISIMIGGSPTNSDKLKSFENRVGTLPLAIKAFWQTHNFSYFRNCSLLSSLEIVNSNSPLFPAILGGKAYDSLGALEEMEFLAIVNVASPMPSCFIRNLGLVTWGEAIFQIDKHGGSCYPETSCSLDELIARSW